MDEHIPEAGHIGVTDMLDAVMGMPHIELDSSGIVAGDVVLVDEDKEAVEVGMDSLAKLSPKDIVDGPPAHILIACSW